MIHAILLLVEVMLFAQNEDLLVHVNVYRTTLETLMLPADQNAQQTLNVLLSWHVKTYIVLIHVQLHAVEIMHNVK